MMSKLSEQIILHVVTKRVRVSKTRVEYPGVEMTVRFVNANLLDPNRKSH